MNLNFYLCPEIVIIFRVSLSFLFNTIKMFNNNTIFNNYNPLAD